MLLYRSPRLGKKYFFKKAKSHKTEILLGLAQLMKSVTCGFPCSLPEVSKGTLGLLLSFSYDTYKTVHLATYFHRYCGKLFSKIFTHPSDYCVPTQSLEKSWSLGSPAKMSVKTSQSDSSILNFVAKQSDLEM